MCNHSRASPSIPARGVDDTLIETLLPQWTGFRNIRLFCGQWRTMASRASRSAGISRFDGLLALAAELCRIVRASYLSPSFTFFLCFELWRYLHSTRRGRRPRRKVTRGSAGSPSFLRLLRGAALAVTLMLPAEGRAQVALPAGPAPPQGSAVAQQGLRENRRRNSGPPVEKHFQERSAELQIPPLRFAPVGMTKERVPFPFELDAAEDEQQVPPLRFATVGMTLLVWVPTSQS